MGRGASKLQIHDEKIHSAPAFTPGGTHALAR